MDDDPIDFGPCCACREKGPTVRNLIALEVRAPIAGTGWGCVVCGRPSNGAIAVVCDACMDVGAAIVTVCHGYAATGVRTARAACTEPFTHDMTKHEED
jgi:hypothetical protein